VSLVVTSFENGDASIIPGNRIIVIVQLEHSVTNVESVGVLFEFDVSFGFAIQRISTPGLNLQRQLKALQMGIVTLEGPVYPSVWGGVLARLVRSGPSPNEWSL